MNDDTIDELLEQLNQHILNAQAKHKPYNSHHEAYAVIYEELCEYFDQVRLWPKTHDPQQMRIELMHIATTALRTIIDLELS